MTKTITRKNKGNDLKMVLIEVPFLIAKLEEDLKELRKERDSYLRASDENSMIFYFRIIDVMMYIERFVFQLRERQEKVVESGGRFIDSLPLLWTYLL